MAEYKCISCGEIKESDKKCMCPVCGYMMFQQPYERREILISEIKKFIDKTINQDIDVKKLNFSGLEKDKKRFPDFRKIYDYVTNAEKTEIFYERLKKSINQMKKYFHETFNKKYTSDNNILENLSDKTADMLEKAMSELGIEIESEKAVFPEIIIEYTESADAELIGIADDLLNKIDRLAEKIFKFIKVNNIYGRAFDKEINIIKIKNISQNDVIYFQKIIAENISECDKIINKKYVVDIFEDGSNEVSEMLKAVWDSIYILMSAPLKKRLYIYIFGENSNVEKMAENDCNFKLSDIFRKRFISVSNLIHSENFLKDKTENELFELYNKMLDLDIYHYMSGAKGNFVVGCNERKLEELAGLSNIKTAIKKIKAYVLANKGNSELNLHMCFLGNPGTGKTEAARIIAGIFYENGILPENKVIETDRSGLVAGYVGQTAIKTAEKIEEAMGGVLFIDEAYSLI